MTTVNKSWPLTPLGEVLLERKERPTTEELASGALPVVAKIGFDNGKIQLRSDRKTRTGMILARPGDLLVSGINAAKGAIAIHDHENKGPIAATIHYGAYTAKEGCVNLRFLWRLLRSRIFREILDAHLPGGIKTELKAKRFLAIEVPLPPIDEQCRIVDSLSQIEARIAEARSLRAESYAAASKFVVSLHLKLSGQRIVPMKGIMQLDERHVPVRPDGTYPQVGIRGFGGGLFGKEPVLGTRTTYREFNLLFDGALVLSQVKGWEGAISVCDNRFAGWYASPEYRTFSFFTDQALPEYMSVVVSSPWFCAKLSDLTRGVGARRERTRPEAFLDMQLPMPRVEHQRRAIPILRKVKSLTKAQSETAAELEALIPSILSKAFRGGL